MQTRDGAFHFFDKSDAGRIQRPAGSLMPQYGSRLSRTDLDDLISYLVRSAGSNLSEKQDEDDEQ